MTGHLDTESRRFYTEVKRKADQFDLRIETADAAHGIVASLGEELLVVFTRDRDGLIVSLASRRRPNDCFAVEYVAVMLGGIETRELDDYQSRLERFVKSVEDGDPPAPLRDTDWLLKWIRNNESELIAQFCVQDPKPRLDAIVHRYLAVSGGN
ncbi:MAG: hypothetical protein F4X98_17200 [Gammaproteobacteria bacterium]|nr:hypothetical protein [Gammaproteobacteria bacterium]